MGLLASKFSSIIASGKGASEKKDFHIVSREEWSANGPREVVVKSSPAKSYTTEVTGTKACKTNGECQREVRRLQNIHMYIMMLHDIGYNFLVGGDGRIYEGRGWNTVCNCTIPTNEDSKTKIEDKSEDNQCIKIGYIGYEETDKMKEAVAELLDYGKRNKYFGESTHESDDEKNS